MPEPDIEPRALDEEIEFILTTATYRRMAQDVIDKIIVYVLDV